ncbi:uncharacterized protein LOC109138582 isoform X3 [Larimichthys crocea]|uniref:uncharacterized protein LOC109138582 isoform X3 n=1 Tax=Larimichthys crocea TaxID=215358 RepID=UPI000F5EB56F|nr:uncharacterized protein LOC109138582 isoform X3 [Larimichthys crocea]
MVQFSWIKVSLSVVLLLQFTAVTGQNQPFTVRVGDDVTLPCGNVTKDQNKCDTTTWKVIWKEVDAAVELVHLGQIRKYSIIEDISGRLSVTENCSLVIKKVTVGDVGRYTCLKSGEQQGPDSHVYLSVVHIEKQQANDSVVLTCAVVTYAGCGYTVQWLHDDDKPVTETSQFGCSAIMTFKKSDNVLLKCKVTDDESGRTLLSSFSLQSSANGGNKTSSAEDDAPTHGNLWIIIVSVGSAALLIVIVAVMIWKKSKGRETQTDGNTEQSLNPAETLSAPQTSEDTTDPEDGVPYASISFIRQTDSEARVCGDGDDAVTYATVKPSSSSAGASADLYATVNHPKTNGAAV